MSYEERSEMLYWGRRECPHCGKAIEQDMAGLGQLTDLFDQANRGNAEGVPLAVSCPHCGGMIKAVLMPTVTVVALTKLQMAPLLLDAEDRPATAPVKRVIKRRAQAATP